MSQTQQQISYHGYTSNNLYDGFPPIMADGRVIVASYQPEAVLNNHLLRELGIKSNWEYRRYLTQNAKDIAQYNYRESANDCGYFKRFQDTTGPYNTPYLYSSYQETTRPKGYETSNQKELYLTREQLESRMVAPVITQEELLKYNQSKNL